MTIPYIDPNLIFAENAPTQDKPAAFENYDKGWDESRKNDGRPLIKQMNYLQQQADLKNRYIHENGSALPYKEGIAYEENAVVVKDGVLQQWKDGVWRSAVESELAGKVDKSSNLSDLTSAASARTNLGLGTAATASLTTSREDNTTGRVLKVGDFGVGRAIARASFAEAISITGFYTAIDNSPIGTPNGNKGGAVCLSNSAGSSAVIFLSTANFAGNLLSVPRLHFRHTLEGSWFEVRSSANTTVDSNGFLKNASPIVQLFADKIELNDEAAQQNIEFEKLGVGDYLVKGSSGFAQEGWYIETPKDANGNVLFSVIYKTLENGDISVKTYKKKFDIETASIVADLDNPVDITESRWIDLRLHGVQEV